MDLLCIRSDTILIADMNDTHCWVIQLVSLQWQHKYPVDYIVRPQMQSSTGGHGGEALRRKQKKNITYIACVVS